MDVLPLLLTRLSRLNTVALEERAASVDITTSEAVLLQCLDLANGVLNPSRLQGLVIQSPGGLTKTLRRLEEAGFVRRRTDPDDRRALLVELTAKGRRTLVRTEAVMTEHYDGLLADLDRAQRDELLDLTRRMLDRLEAATGMPSSAGVLGVRQ